jgi:predicted nucleic acid-binding protein
VSFPAFFDTNVLYGAFLSDVILGLADRGLYRPLWSADVLRELRRNLVDAVESPTLIEKRVSAMETYFPDAMVAGYADVIGSMTCDPKDRHVLAAAVRGNAAVLVTFNLKDFPEASTDAFDLEVVHPDDFLLDQLDLYPAATLGTIRELVDAYDSPALSETEFLEELARAHVPRFAAALRRAREDS